METNCKPGKKSKDMVNYPKSSSFTYPCSALFNDSSMLCWSIHLYLTKKNVCYIYCYLNNIIFILIALYINSLYSECMYWWNCKANKVRGCLDLTQCGSTKSAVKATVNSIHRSDSEILSNYFTNGIKPFQSVFLPWKKSCCLKIWKKSKMWLRLS